VGIREGADGSKHLLAAPVGLRDLVETVPSPRLSIGLLRLEETVQVIESLGFLLGSGRLCPLAR
jgi:hypothetical protein